jgi:hypothetical protein
VDLDDTIDDLAHSDVERPAAEIEDDRAQFASAFVKAVRERCSTRFVDDAFDAEAGDLGGARAVPL